jgi:hypothetical protein
VTLQELFHCAIQRGIVANSRGRAAVRQKLHRKRVSFGDQAFFDPEQITIPYADSRVLHGSPDRQVRKIMVGIDIESPELLLADRLNEKGADIDLVLAHHPEDAYANFFGVRKEAEKHHIHMVMAGHISSDTLGQNLLLDKFEVRELQLVECSGFKRFIRSA